MKKIVYDAAQWAAAIIISTGVWGQWGWPIALIVFGGLVLALGFIDIIIVRIR